jgi:hypothetical protein
MQNHLFEKVRTLLWPNRVAHAAPSLEVFGTGLWLVRACGHQTAIAPTLDVERTQYPPPLLKHPCTAFSEGNKAHLPTSFSSGTVTNAGYTEQWGFEIYGRYI